jgi:hypothetical protein
MTPRPMDLFAMRPGKSLLLFLIVLVPGLVLLRPSAAAARKKRVVILPFVGPGAHAARQGLSQAILRQIQSVQPKTYSRMADRLDVEPNTEAGIKKVCAKLRCEAVVVGRVQRKSAGAIRVVVTVHDGSDGSVLGRRAATVRGMGNVRRAGAALGRACLALVTKAGSGGRSDADEPEVESPPDGRKRTDDPLADSSTDPSRTSADRSTNTTTRSNLSTLPPVDKQPTTVKRAEAGPTRRGIFELGVSMGISTRSYALQGADPSFDSRYDGGVFPEFTINAEFYPLAFFLKNFAKNIGLGLAYTRHLSISTTIPNQNTAVDTGSQQFVLDLRLRWALFDRATSPVLSGWVGWGLREFSLSPNTILTSFNYKFVRIGVGGFVPILTPLFGVEASFEVRPLLSVGLEAVDSYGDRDGGFAYGVRGGLRGQAGFGLTYFVSVEYQSFTMGFVGLPPNLVRPGTPDRSEPTRGFDRYVRVWAGVGYGM